MTATEQDPLAMFRPQYENEKPDAPGDDPLFAFRPETEQKKYKQPVEHIYEPTAEAMPGTEAPWWEKLGKAFALQSRISGAVEPEAVPTIAKSALSGATLGASELVPGLKVGEEYPEIAEAYKLGGSLPTIGILNKVFSGPLVKLAEKSPYATKALTSLADIMGWGATGAAEKTLTEAFQGKMPSAEDVLAHGGEWALLDATLKTAGLGGKFATWLLDKAKGTKQPAWEVVNNLLTDMKKEGIDISATDRVTAKVLSEFEKPIETAKGKEIRLSKEAPPEAAERVGIETLKETPEALPPELQIDLAQKKIEPIQFERISANSEALAKPYQPGEIDAQGAMQEIERTRADELVERVGERSETTKTFGENIKADIEKNFKEAEKQYQPLYSEVEAGAKEIKHKPDNTIKLANTILDHINSLKTKPEGYQKVINTLNDTLQDMGYHIAEIRGGKIVVRDIAGNPIKLTPFAVQEEVSLSQTMELARRLNKIVDYDIVGPSIKNQLKPVVNSLKKEIKKALEEANPDLHKKFVQAEGMYADTAKKYSHEAITGIRGQQKPERIASSILEPTTLENLKKIVSPAQFNAVQREILQHLRDLPFEKARRAYREIAPFLDKNAQDAARSLISHKAPHGKFAPVIEIKSGIISDLNKAFTTGQRPSKVLDLWKTIKGQKLIEEALEGTPNKKEVLEYLRKQSFYDFASSVVNEAGEVNFKKLETYLKDPATIRNLHQIGGEEAVKFFKSIKNMSKGIEFNVNMLERFPKVEMRPGKGKYRLGEEKLLRGAEKLRTPSEEVQKFREILPPAKPEKISHRRGEVKLEEAARKRQPFKFKLEDFLEDYGLSSVSSLFKALGLLKYTKTFGGLVGLEVGAKKLYRMATNPSARKSINELLITSKKATGGTHDITPLLVVLSEMDEEFTD